MPDKSCRPSIAELEAMLNNTDGHQHIEMLPDGSIHTVNLDFRKELENLINRHSMENGCNTPDFILAEYMHACLVSFNVATRAREHWYGRRVF